MVERPKTKTPMKASSFILVSVMMMATCARAVIFELRPNREKCFTEQGRKGTAFSGKFSILYSDTLEQVPSKTYNNLQDDGRYFIFRVNDPNDKEILRTEEHMGTFHFTPTSDGAITLCFADIGSGITRRRSVSFEHHHGTTTDEYREIAKRDELYVNRIYIFVLTHLYFYIIIFFINLMYHNYLIKSLLLLN